MFHQPTRLSDAETRALIERHTLTTGTRPAAAHTTHAAGIQRGLPANCRTVRVRAGQAPDPSAYLDTAPDMLHLVPPVAPAVEASDNVIRPFGLNHWGKVSHKPCTPATQADLQAMMGNSAPPARRSSLAFAPPAVTAPQAPRRRRSDYRDAWAMPQARRRRALTAGLGLLGLVIVGAVAWLRSQA